MKSHLFQAKTTSIKRIMFQTKDEVRLNEAGIDCYRRNRNDKNIDPAESMIIIASCGYDSGKEIFEVRQKSAPSKCDYYFEGCLTKSSK